MSGLYRREVVDSLRGWLRRSAKAALALAMASALWYMLHPALIRATARSSLGCDERAPLLYAEVCRHLADSDVTLPRDPSDIRSSNKDGCAGAAWCAQPWGGPSRAEGEDRTTWFFVDARFDLVGKLRTRNTTSTERRAPRDRDGDGNPELLCKLYKSASSNVVTWCVVRLKPAGNELAGIVHVYKSAPSLVNSRVYAGWVPSQSGGTSELDVYEWRMTPVPGRVTTGSRADTLAELKWAEVGGVISAETEHWYALVWPATAGPVATGNMPIDDIVDEVFPAPPLSIPSRPATTSAPTTQP